MQHTIVGIFRSSAEATRAVEQLRSSGFSDSDIDVRESDLHYKDTPYGVNDENRYDPGRSNAQANLDVLNEDRIRDRRRDDDDISDTIGRFFRNLFDNKEDAERYSDLGRRNHVVSVYTTSPAEAETAADVLDECGAINLDEEGTYATSRSAQGTDLEHGRNPDNDVVSEPDAVRNDLGPGNTEARSIPVIEESLNVSKREQQRGGVRVRARIVERPVEERIRLREERINVERNPVNRSATDADFAAFREGEVELTESTEVPVVSKEVRVVEEVRLSKDVSEREEVVGDTVRGTDVTVENLNTDEVKARRRKKK